MADSKKNCSLRERVHGVAMLKKLGPGLITGAAMILGLGIDYSTIDPIKALVWSAELNGFIAVPIMAAMIMVASSKNKMGQFRVCWFLGGLGWTTAAMMAAATVTMVYVSF